MPRIFVSAFLSGLSPRVRSHPLLYYDPYGPFGSISACAESPRDPVLREYLVEVYLRVCGVTKSTIFVAVVILGLSPRVRSHLDDQIPFNTAAGSISACAESPS